MVADAWSEGRGTKLFGAKLISKNIAGRIVSLRLRVSTLRSTQKLMQVVELSHWDTNMML